MSHASGLDGSCPPSAFLHSEFMYDSDSDSDSGDSNCSDEPRRRDPYGRAHLLASLAAAEEEEKSGAAAAAAEDDDAPGENEVTAVQAISDVEPHQHIAVAAAAAAAAASPWVDDVTTLNDRDQALFHKMPLTLADPGAVVIGDDGHKVVPMGTLLYRTLGNHRWAYRLRGSDFEMVYEIKQDAAKAREKLQNTNTPSAELPTRLAQVLQWESAKGLRKEMATVQRVHSVNPDLFYGMDLEPAHTETCVVSMHRNIVYFIPIPLENVKHIRKNTPSNSWSIDTPANSKKKIHEARQHKNVHMTKDGDYYCLLPMSFYRTLEAFGDNPDDHTAAAQPAAKGKKRKATAAPDEVQPAAAGAVATEGAPAPTPASTQPKKKAKLPGLTARPDKFLFAEAKSNVEQLLGVARAQTNVTALEFFRVWRSRLLSVYDVPNRRECGDKLKALIESKRPSGATAGSEAELMLWFSLRIWLGTTPHGKEYLDSVEQTLLEEQVPAGAL